jgi:fucose permease
MTGNYGVMAVAISGALVCGMMLALLGGLKLALAKRLELGEGRVGTLVSALHLALLPMALLCGLVLDRFGSRPVLIAGSVVLCLGVVALGARPSHNGALAALLAAGLGWAALATASLVLMPRAFFPGEPSASLNLGNVFVALGALVGAALADVLLRTMDLRRALGLIAFVCLLPGVAAAVPPQLDAAPAHHAGLAALVGSSAVTLWMAGLVFFFYAPLEASVSVWATSYLTERGHDERRAGRLLAGFWAAFLASRLLVAAAQHVGWLPPAADALVLVLPALLAAVVLGNLAGTANRNNAPVALALLGFLLGPIFPTLLGVVFRTFPEERGTAFGSVFALGSLGGLLLAPLVGGAAQRRSVQEALRLPMLLALLLTAVALVFALTIP